jgi:hypothetical protein
MMATAYFLCVCASVQCHSPVIRFLQFKTVKPSGERVLIKLGAPEAKTASGILLPAAKDTDRPEGQVVEVGEGKFLKV